MKQLVFIITITLFSPSLFGQSTIELINPSLEGEPHQGTIEYGYFYSPMPNGWTDCGRFIFPKQTPGDIHPNNFWGVTTEPDDGKTYLGLVARENNTYESVCTRLDQELERGICYEFDIKLCISENYWSRVNHMDEDDINFNTPIVLKVYLANSLCGKDYLIGTTDPIDHTQWGTYIFDFEAEISGRYLILEAYYSDAEVDAHNGHILIDNFSSIDEITCRD